MNTAKVTALVKQVVSAIAGYMSIHGATKAAAILNGEDSIGIIVLLVVFIYSHFIQHTDENEATPTPLPASKGGGILPPVVCLLILAGLTGVLLVGCASFNANVYNGENTLVDTATAATHGFNLYYKQATNGATDVQIQKLTVLRDQIYADDIQLGNALTVTEGLRLAYMVNSADTNKTALDIAYATLASQSSNIVWEIHNVEAAIK